MAKTLLAQVGSTCPGHRLRPGHHKGHEAEGCGNRDKARPVPVPGVLEQLLPIVGVGNRDQVSQPVGQGKARAHSTGDNDPSRRAAPVHRISLPQSCCAGRLASAVTTVSHVALLRVRPIQAT